MSREKILSELANELAEKRIAARGSGFFREVITLSLLIFSISLLICNHMDVAIR